MALKHLWRYAYQKNRQPNGQIGIRTTDRPYDNAVSEATYKTFKIEFVYLNVLDSLEKLKPLLSGYVHWCNHIRLHLSLGHMSPVEYKSLRLNNFI